jgi:hypothetical protein
MAVIYYVYITNESEESDSDKKYDFKTTRKSEYKKFAKEALKNGADSVDVWADIKNECDGTIYPSLVKTFYPEDFNLNS